MNNGTKVVFGILAFIPLTCGVLSVAYTQNSDFKTWVDEKIARNPTSSSASSSSYGSSSSGVASSSKGSSSSSSSSSTPAGWSGTPVSSESGTESIFVEYSGSGKMAAVGQKEYFTVTLDHPTTANTYLALESSDATKVSISSSGCASGTQVWATCVSEFTGTVTITITKEVDANVKKTLSFSFEENPVTSADLTSLTMVSDDQTNEIETISEAQFVNDAIYGWSLSVSKEPMTGGGSRASIDCLSKNSDGTKGTFDWAYLTAKSTISVIPSVSWWYSLSIRMVGKDTTKYPTGLSGSIGDYDTNGKAAFAPESTYVNGNVFFRRSTSGETSTNLHEVPDLDPISTGQTPNVKGVIKKNSDFSITMTIYLGHEIFENENARYKNNGEAVPYMYATYRILKGTDYKSVKIYERSD